VSEAEHHNSFWTLLTGPTIWTNEGMQSVFIKSQKTVAAALGKLKHKRTVKVTTRYMDTR